MADERTANIPPDRMWSPQLYIFVTKVILKRSHFEKYIEERMEES